MPRVINLPADLTETSSATNDDELIFRQELLSTLGLIEHYLRTILNHQRLITGVETDELIKEL